TNLFYGTGIPAAILVINRHKPKARKGKVLFVDASRGFKQGTTQNYLRDVDVSEIVTAFVGFEDIDKYATVASLKDIEANDFSLNISRYVDTSETSETVDVKTALAN